MLREIRGKVRNQDSFQEFSGYSGMLWFMNSADHSFHWDSENCPTIGLYRDFKAKPQVLRDTYGACYHLKGRKAKGWITVLAFDGSIDYRPEVKKEYGIR